MVETAIRLGEVDLSSYVESPSVDESRQEYAERVLADYPDGRKSLFGNELVPWQHLMAKREGYQRINPEFLRMSGVVESIWGKEREIRVPRFGVFKRSVEGFADFGVLYRPNSYEGKSLSCNVRFSGSNHEGDALSRVPEISPLLTRQLVRSTEYAHKSIFEPEEFDRASWHLRVKKARPLTVITSFRGLIPRKTKELFPKADEIFGPEVYLIAEVKREDWRTPPIQSGDPLLIGVTDDHQTAYLVDHFDATPLEDFARMEFTEENGS